MGFSEQIYELGKRVYGADIDIEAMTVAAVRKQGLAGVVSEVVQKPVVWVLQRMEKTRGKTRVPVAFKDRWPDDVALGKFKVVQCLRLCLVPRLARTLGRDLEEVRGRLTAAVPETRVRKLFGGDWPA